MRERRIILLILSCCWRCLWVGQGLGDIHVAEPSARIMLLSPVNGEVFSALPIVLSYRIVGVDFVEVRPALPQPGPLDTCPTIFHCQYVLRTTSRPSCLSERVSHDADIPRRGSQVFVRDGEE